MSKSQMKQRFDGRLVLMCILGTVLVIATVLQVLEPLLLQGLLAPSYAYGTRSGALPSPSLFPSSSPLGLTPQLTTIITPTPQPTIMMPTATSDEMGSGGGMGTTAILAQDTFQRPDQRLWGTASDERSWRGDANTLLAFSITGAIGTIDHGQGPLNAVLDAATSNVEVNVQGSINVYQDTAVNLGVVLRWTDANNWYKCFIDAGTLTILKRVKGVTTTLASLPFHAQNHRTYTLRFRAIGAILFASAWSSMAPEPPNWMLVTTDTSLTQGQVGIRVLVQPTTVVRITSFLATTATGSI